MNENEYIEHIRHHRNDIKRCPVCNSNIEDRKVGIFKELIVSLHNIYMWCGEHQTHEFNRKEIKHLLKSHNCYARFGDLVRFGGIVYRPIAGKRGIYGINMKRAKAFFAGKYKIPMMIVLNQITNERVAASYVSIYDIPELREYLDETNQYDESRLILSESEQRKLPTVEEYYN